MIQVFGQAIRRVFIADDGHKYVILPQQTPAIYLFAFQPSQAQARSGSGAVSSVVTWTQPTDNPSRAYTLPAVADPTPNDPVVSRDYWEAVNFILETSGQVQTKLRSITLTRAGGIEAAPGTTKQDIKDLWPSVSSYISDAELDKYLAIAEMQTRIDLECKGRQWAQLSELPRLKYAIAFKAIVAMAVGQVARGNADKFQWLVDYFTTEYANTLTAICLPFDADNDGMPDVCEQQKTSTVYTER
jgi:hypothetical protein